MCHEGLLTSTPLHPPVSFHHHSSVTCITLQDSIGYAPPSSEDEVASPSQSETEEENEPDGVFTFRRKKYTNYHAVSYFSRELLFSSRF